MITIRAEILTKPSSSKGWGRYRVEGANGQAVMESRTGNPWLSANHSGDVEAGAEILIELDVELQVGKGGGYARKERSQQRYRLIAEEGQTTDVEHRPGSQGIQVRIHGARQA